MALFIHSENQNLLWTIISNMDITKSVFVEGSPKKSIWFKNVIEEFYIKLYGRNINAQQLREINKEVIAYMVDNLRNMKGAFSQTPRQEPQTLYQQYPPGTQENYNSFSSRNPIKEKGMELKYPEGAGGGKGYRGHEVASTLRREAPLREPGVPPTLYSRSNESTRNPDEYNEKFNNRQKEYETMIKKPQPPEIKFTDVVKDEPISNMEELLKKQQQMRDYELSQPRFEVIQPQNNPDKIKINNQQNITIEVDNELTENKQKKVSWSDEFDIKAEFQEIKTQLRQLFKLIEGLPQHYPPGTQEYFRGFSSRNPITEKGKELEFPEGAGGGKGYRGHEVASTLRREAPLREPGVPPSLQQIRPVEPMINSPKIVSDVNSI